MDEFKAASGRKVKQREDGSLFFGKVQGYLSRDAAFDAEEFFQAKHDEKLGRWRYPLDPDYVVYPSDQYRAGEAHGWIRVVNERTSFVAEFTRHSTGDPMRPEPGFATAARAFFEAHPQRKPWEDARVGQVWALSTSRGSEHAASFDGNRWRWANGSKIPPDILRQLTKGRRIWPEEGGTVDQLLGEAATAAACAVNDLTKHGAD